MSRSKKDGKHGGAHKMHWRHANCRAGYMYCALDNCGPHCAGNCKWYSQCRKLGATNKKKENNVKIQHDKRDD